MIPDVHKQSYTREYRIGTLFKIVLGALYRYVKIDLGSAGKDNKGKRLGRIIVYVWVPWNGSACTIQKDGD